MNSPTRKRRTREHVIADLSVNHVERHALLCGHTIERFLYDYGIDLRLFTYGPDGEPEDGNILLQLKKRRTRSAFSRVKRLLPSGSIDATWFTGSAKPRRSF